MSRREHGYVMVRYHNDATQSLAASERERVVTAWRDGARYFEGVDEYGGEVTFSLDGVRAVAYISPAALAASRAEDALDRLDGVL